MAEALRLFLLAGEASGDRIGADLVRRLRQRTPLELSGVGGEELTSEGLQSQFPMSDLSVMGWSDVLGRLPLLLWRARQVANAIIRTKPDIVVLIDSQVFNRVVAERVRKAGSRVPLLLYVAPAVWAWGAERAAKLKPLFDEVLAVLPFEPRVMAELSGPTTSYVGHPALSRHPLRPEQPQQGPVLLLPGSRVGELRRHMGLMRAAVDVLKDHPAVTGFALPTLESLRPKVAKAVSDWPVPVQVLTGNERGKAFAEAVAAFAVSGTVTLELAMSGVPMVLTYVADRAQASRFAANGKVPTIGLPNIIAGRNVVPELVFAGEPGIDSVVRSLQELLEPAEVSRQLEGFREIRVLMQKGAPEAPLQDAVDRVLAHRPQRPAIGS